MQRKLKGEGGMLAYLGTTDLVEAERRMEGGDTTAKGVIDAMAMQLAKDICSLLPVVCGQVDAVILTGGMAHSEYLTGEIAKRVRFAAPIQIIPGTCEMEALAKGVYRAFTGVEQYHTMNENNNTGGDSHEDCAL